jgi:hypothetical protein
MEKHRTNSATASPALLDETWFYPIETAHPGSDYSGRDASFLAPPGQIRACPIKALGSYLDAAYPPVGHGGH